MRKLNRRLFLAHLGLIFTLLLMRGDGPQPRPLFVFLGDSITANWPIAEMLPGFNVVNAGVGGQMSSEILARFDRDVIQRRAQFVVIEAGGNDLNNNVVPSDVTRANILMMIALARAHGIQPIIAGMVPESSRWYQLRDPHKLTALDAWLRDLAEKQHLLFLDFYNPLNGPDRDTFTADGLHPNLAGYDRLVHIVQTIL